MNNGHIMVVQVAAQATKIRKHWADFNLFNCKGVKFGLPCLLIAKSFVLVFC